MKYSIQHPDLLEITDSNENKSYFGPNQEWYTDSWQAMAGCGPTSASIVTAYLAFTRLKCRALYSPGKMTKVDFLQHMNEVYKFVTPEKMGLNKISMYAGGVIAFAASRDITLTPQSFDVRRVQFGQREPSLALADFVAEGLGSNCPLSFLALSHGRENILQDWHWITITSAEIEGEDIRVHASDEGRKIFFNLQLWYTTTGLPGGLVYFIS